MMRYKVGDTVKIRKNLEIGRVYGNYYVTQRMHALGGAIVRIAKVFKDAGCYRIDSCSLNWTDEMFEDVDTEVQKMDKHVVIDVYGDEVVARRGDKRGVARCHPDDDFDFYTGAKLALERLEDAENPYAWLKEGTRYYVPVPAASDLHKGVTYTADDWDKMIMKRGIVFQTREEAIACAKKILAAVKQEG